MIRRILGQALKWACTALLVLAVLFLISGLHMGERPGPLLFFVGVLAAPFFIRLLVLRRHRTAAPAPKAEASQAEDRDELSERFSSRYSEEIKGYEDRIYETAQLIGPAGKKWMKTATPEEIAEKIRLCQNTIDAFEDFRAFCGKHGKGGRIYFEDMWEHCHNSANPDFSYIDSIVSLQNELKSK